MSLNLYMAPVVEPPPTCLGGHPLKGLLCDAFGDYDGSLTEGFTLTESHLPILQMLLNMEQKKMDRLNRSGQSTGDEFWGHKEIRDGLTEVIEAIKEHKQIRLWTAE